jgi:uncharacterized protein YggE
VRWEWDARCLPPLQQLKLAIYGTATAATIHATGEARVPVQPDRTSLHIGVVTTAGSAARAASRNAVRTSAVLARIREALGPGADIHTANYSLRRNFPDGFFATNTVDVTAPDAADRSCHEARAHPRLRRGGQAGGLSYIRAFTPVTEPVLRT